MPPLFIYPASPKDTTVLRWDEMIQWPQVCPPFVSRGQRYQWPIAHFGVFIFCIKKLAQMNINVGETMSAGEDARCPESFARDLANVCTGV